MKKILTTLFIVAQIFCLGQNNNSPKDIFIGLEINGYYRGNLSNQVNLGEDDKFRIILTPEIGKYLPKGYYVAAGLGYSYEQWKYTDFYDYRWQRSIVNLKSGKIWEWKSNMKFFAEINPIFQYQWYRQINMEADNSVKRDHSIYLLGLNFGLIFNIKDQIELLPKIDVQHETHNQSNSTELLKVLPKLGLRYNIK